MGKVNRKVLREAERQLAQFEIFAPRYVADMILYLEAKRIRNSYKESGLKPGKVTRRVNARLRMACDKAVMGVCDDLKNVSLYGKSGTVLDENLTPVCPSSFPHLIH